MKGAAGGRKGKKRQRVMNVDLLPGFTFDEQLMFMVLLAPAKKLMTWRRRGERERKG